MNTEIYQHNIEYWFRGDSDRILSECDIEHIENSIKEGYNQGELCQYDVQLDTEIRGWWKINNKGGY